MKGIVLLINEPPNNRRVVFKYCPLDLKSPNLPLPSLNSSLPHSLQQSQQHLIEVYNKFPQLCPVDNDESANSQQQISSGKRPIEENKTSESSQVKTIFGLEKSFFSELFIPKEYTFQNSIFDLTVEANRFLSYPYFFEEITPSSGKGKASKKNKQADDHNKNGGEMA